MPASPRLNWSSPTRAVSKAPTTATPRSSRSAPATACGRRCVVVSRPEWVSFVVDTIRKHEDVDSVAFALRRSDNSRYLYHLDHRTWRRSRTRPLGRRLDL